MLMLVLRSAPLLLLPQQCGTAAQQVDPCHAWQAVHLCIIAAPTCVSLLPASLTPAPAVAAAAVQVSVSPCRWLRLLPSPSQWTNCPGTHRPDSSSCCLMTKPASHGAPLATAPYTRDLQTRAHLRQTRELTVWPPVMLAAMIHRWVHQFAPCFLHPGGGEGESWGIEEWCGGGGGGLMRRHAADPSPRCLQPRDRQRVHQQCGVQ